MILHFKLELKCSYSGECNTWFYTKKKALNLNKPQFTI
jgi:hypothetical protein